MNRNLPISTLWQPSQWPAHAAGRKNLALLVQLRWLAIAGQLITILAVHFVMDIRLPIAPMLLIAGMAILMNGLSFGALRKRTDVSHAELFLSLLFDVLLLTAQLYLSGGATNPFISLYLVQVALGAVLLDRWSIWGIVFVSALCAGLLALHYRPLDLHGALEGHLFDLHIVGTWVCLTDDRGAAGALRAAGNPQSPGAGRLSRQAEATGGGGGAYRSHGPACIRRGA